MCSVIGLGFVGSALVESFRIKNVQPLCGYDKYKDGGIGSLDSCLETPVIFICLPTPYDEIAKRYDQASIDETLNKLYESRYTGTVVLKSTVEPGTTEEYEKQYPSLNLAHNPEFLSAATAFNDFHNQKHIVLGRGSKCGYVKFDKVKEFYETNYPQAELSLCTSNESESMKCFVNTFYAVKIQYFNELYVLCQKNGTSYDNVKDMMLKNGWINPMHTSVPGRDGKLSYGGGCFPKDTNALLQHMKSQGTPHAVLEGCIKERDLMRSEGYNPFGNTVNGNSSSEKMMNGTVNGCIQNGHELNGSENVANGHELNGSENVANGHMINGMEKGHTTNGSKMMTNGHSTNGTKMMTNGHSTNVVEKIINGQSTNDSKIKVNGHLTNEFLSLENGLVMSGREALR